ncbi:hypothetical protein V8G54_014356 [Vigna mungo]|uniref:Uncharacterized protein n=1 Tax=Vigna mungo TaxID=3915 RepID=A0AAQ3RZ62_VIGMU
MDMNISVLDLKKNILCCCGQVKLMYTRFASFRFFTKAVQSPLTHCYINFKQHSSKLYLCFSMCACALASSLTGDVLSVSARSCALSSVYDVGTGLLLNPEERGICFFSSISEGFSLTKLVSKAFSDTCWSATWLTSLEAMASTFSEYSINVAFEILGKPSGVFSSPNCSNCSRKVAT